jgi:hypothetical protein
MTVPDGAQRSEDGKYWWDGADWQPVTEESKDNSTAGSGEQSADVGQLSEDGQWKWDGSQWQPVEAGAAGAEGAGAGAAGGDDGAAAGGDLAAALAGQGIAIAPEAADAGYIQQVAEHLNNWYTALDENSRAIVDALSKQGADALLADPEVGVVTEGDPLVTAFSGNTMTLNESLQATNQALEQTAAY